MEDLQGFDGKEQRPAYVAYKGKVYDVSSSRLWKDGSHAKKHMAGHDMTDALKTAPHREEQILRMPEVGRLVETSKSNSIFDNIYNCPLEMGILTITSPPKSVINYLHQMHP